MSKLHSPEIRLIAMLITLLFCSKTTFAYDFSAVCPSGQTLYYNIIDATNHYVELTCPNQSGGVFAWNGFTKPTGAITLSSSVTFNGVPYTMTAIGDWALLDCSQLTGTLSIPTKGTVWIAFPYSEGKTPAAVFTGFGVNGDVIKGQLASARCAGSNWVGQLKTLEPGQGYIFTSNATVDRTFTFTASKKQY